MKKLIAITLICLVMPACKKRLNVLPDLSRKEAQIEHHKDSITVRAALCSPQDAEHYTGIDNKMLAPWNSMWITIINDQQEPIFIHPYSILASHASLKTLQQLDANNRILRCIIPVSLTIASGAIAVTPLVMLGIIGKAPVIPLFILLLAVSAKGVTGLTVLTELILAGTITTSLFSANTFASYDWASHTYHYVDNHLAINLFPEEATIEPATSFSRLIFVAKNNPSRHGDLYLKTTDGEVTFDLSPVLMQ